MDNGADGRGGRRRADREKSHRKRTREIRALLNLLQLILFVQPAESNRTARERAADLPCQALLPNWGWSTNQTVPGYPYPAIAAGDVDPVSCMAQRLLATLARTLGSEQAALELKWMRQAVADRESSTSLDEMVRRRSLGEPLQYILGMCLEVIVP